MDVMVVHALMKRVRGDLRLVGGDGADALILVPDVKITLARFRGKCHGSKCLGL